tara:strand:+ start:886 stop:1515 length:630 start_codon:yes stop_codon:yes gene_type:complete
MKPTLVGITGRMRTGKTTLANALADIHNGKVVSFATYVRREVAEGFFPIRVSSAIDDEFNPAMKSWLELETANKSSIRPILQAWGHGKRTLISTDYWVDAMDRDLKNSDEDIIFIDDVRYPNEIDYIVSNGGFIVRLECDTDILLERGASRLALTHASENAIDRENLTLQESLTPYKTTAFDSGLASAESLQTWVSRWLLTMNGEVQNE